MKLIIFICAAIILTSLSAHANLSQEDLWRFLQTEQTQDLGAGLSGGWAEEVVQAGAKDVLFSDVSPFSALQIMILLDDLHSKYLLPDYLKVKDRFKPFVDYYINHRLNNEPLGAIGFWPVWKLPDGTEIRSPSTDPQIRQMVGNRLPADIDDSSQMAIWLLKTQPTHPFLKAYLKMLEGLIDSGKENRASNPSGAFYTWIGIPPSDNSVDCVVNINVLNSLSLTKRIWPLSNTLKTAEQTSSAWVLKALKKSQFPHCSSYYSRGSQFFLALGKLYESGGGVFSNDDWNIIQTSFQETLVKAWNNRNEATLEWAEFLLAARKLQITDRTVQSLLLEIRAYLLQQLHDGTYYKRIEGNDVFYGQMSPVMTLFWYVKAQSAAFLLGALN